MTFCESHAIINKKQNCPVGLLSGLANVRWAPNHRDNVRSGYCPIGLLSYLVTVSWATIPPANVQLG